jgi:cytochrome c oxidase assembly protein Cox11
LIEYVIGELNDMEKHCEKASASKHDDSVVQNVFATAFIVAGAAYAGKKAYDAYHATPGYSGINNSDQSRASL